jgi:hypothetical protein
VIGWFVTRIDGVIGDMRDRGLRRYIGDVWKWKWVIAMNVIYDIWRGAGFVMMYTLFGGAKDWNETERAYWSWKVWMWWK